MLKNTRSKTIGIFDSGFGGLNIMRGIVKELPEYDFVYLGDTARVPYGTRSKETIYMFTKQAVNFLFKKNCDLIILACNTASSDALRKIQQEYLPKFYPHEKVLGVIVPTTEYAAIKTRNKRIGVIATPATISSKSFPQELLKINPKIKVFQNACPLLVPLIEANEYHSKAASIILKAYLSPLINNKIDTLILGCTHYGVLTNKIKKIVGQNVSVVSEASIIGKSLKAYLKRHPEIERNLAKNRNRIFYSTDLTDNFKRLGDKFFGEKIQVRRVSLE